ncbi:carboxymuconolactone decarboxylase family protein [Spongiibacter sp. KMU-166]|uniref:Carboxymuconolactone decarboxylase family protein n=2 Tax=Spongiibacter thalassae TaxID=2721624 RepID=A0ABX1GA11_9GAMM|nr:carboxymuconolactone decarboxylase family protein [Spongiibacter thalassae]
MFGDGILNYLEGKAGSEGFGSQGARLALRDIFGGVWVDDTLSPRERSIATLSMLIALRAEGEIQNHVRGAVNNGLSAKEIEALILHSAYYCGFPASGVALQAAETVLTEMGKLNNAE